ncbi:hypothetical protein WEI85_17765 [Actinomycetes bacterium KLBMP 9797]
MDPLNTAIHIFLSDIRGALALWLLLMAAAAVPFLVISVPAARQRRAEAKRRTAAERAVRPARRRTSPRDDLRRYAEEVAIAAERAAAMAERRRAAWAGVLRTQEAAWRAYDEATEAARRAKRAAAFRIPNTPSTSDELADRRRHLERRATEALRRGELTATEYGDILAHRNGWDPHAHPLVQDTRFALIRRDRLSRACAIVSEVERAAWHAAETAMAARRSLNEEAVEAALRVRAAEIREAARNRRSVRLPVRAPRPAPAWSADTIIIPTATVDTVPIRRPALT